MQLSRQARIAQAEHILGHLRQALRVGAPIQQSDKVTISAIFYSAEFDDAEFTLEELSTKVGELGFCSGGAVRDLNAHFLSRRVASAQPEPQGRTAPTSDYTRAMLKAALRTAEHLVRSVHCVVPTDRDGHPVSADEPMATLADDLITTLSLLIAAAKPYVDPPT